MRLRFQPGEFAWYVGYGYTVLSVQVITYHIPLNPIDTDRVPVGIRYVNACSCVYQIIPQRDLYATYQLAQRRAQYLYDQTKEEEAFGDEGDGPDEEDDE